MNMDKKFVICINNESYDASLERGKIYQVIEDDSAVQHNLVGIIDESGEDYLFPGNYFVAIKLPKVAKEALVV